MHKRGKCECGFNDYHKTQGFGGCNVYNENIIEEITWVLE